MKRTLYTLYPVSLLLGVILFCNNCSKRKEEQNLPVLITVPASNITATSALLGGQIAYDGGDDIFERGLCYGINPDPEITDSKKIAGQGTGSFTCTLTGLNPNTLHYARAYATNSTGTAYGGEVRFTTSSAKAPTVITTTSVSVSFYSASAGGRVTDNGGAPITEKGICWATDENPTLIKDKKVRCNYRIIDNYAAYICVIDSLQPESLYYARAYAINLADTSYGDTVSITTLAVPEVSTLAATNIGVSYATVGGNVVLPFEAFEIERGICYETHINPTIYDQYIKAGTSGAGEYKCNLSNLKSSTLYYARAYVTWGAGNYFPGWTIYGNEVTFSTTATR